MKTMSSPRRVAWPRLWVTMRMRVPSVRISRMMRSTAALAEGSRLAVGSSSSSRRGLVSQARASARRCCSPPESWRALSPARSARPTRSSISTPRRRCSAPATPSGLSPRTTLSSTDMRSIIGRWNTIITPCCGRDPPAPPQAMRPALGSSSPQIVRSSTLLPAPLGPSTRVMPSSPSSRSTPASTSRPSGAKRRSWMESGKIGMTGLTRSAASPTAAARRRAH